MLGLATSLIFGLSATAPALEEGSDAPTNSTADEAREPWTATESGLKRGAASADLGCQPTTWLEHQGQVYVACKSAAWTFIAENPEQRSPLVVDGSVNDFFERNGEVWAEVLRLEARPILRGSATEPSISQDAKRAPVPDSPSSTPDARPTSVVGSVVEVSKQTVTITLGVKDGLTLDDNVELFEITEVTLGGVAAQRERKVAVGRVVDLTETRARVELGVNENAPVGTSARPTSKDRTRSLVAPPRSAEYVNVHVGLRPMLTLGTIGFGSVSDFAATWRARSSLAVHLIGEPLAFSVAGGTRASLFGLLAVSYDHRLFEIGLGIGGGFYRYVDQRGFDPTFNPEGPTETWITVPGLSIGQIVRLGALDGLHLGVRNSFMLFDQGSGASFAWGSTAGELQIPVGRRLWLVLGGGGGRGAWGFGELGLKAILRGNGGPGTLFLTPALGGSGVGDTAGPMVGITIDYRAGLRK